MRVNRWSMELSALKSVASWFCVRESAGSTSMAAIWERRSIWVIEAYVNRFVVEPTNAGLVTLLP